MVRYFSEQIDFVLRGRMWRRRWLSAVASDEGRIIGDVSIIFCSDDYIIDVNRKYLGHDYFTDIITFDYCSGNKISGDLFISIDTVKDNSGFYQTDFEDELDRVMVHGILHLAGYGDFTDEEKKIMREKEDFYLSKRGAYSR